MTVQTLWNEANAVLRRKYIAVQAYLKKQDRSQICNLTLYLNKLEKEQQISSKVDRRKEMKNTRAEINDIETKQ